MKLAFSTALLLALASMFATACSEIDLVPVQCVENTDCTSAGEVCNAGICEQTAVASIQIVNPEPSVLNANSVILEVDVANFALDPAAIGGSPVEGRGHWHYFLNGTYLGVSGTETVAITRLPTGTNEIEVRLAENNHREIDGASDQIEIEVTAESRALVITQPVVERNNAFAVADHETIEVAFDVRNFEMVPDAIGGAPDPCLCRGHVHLYVDGEFQTAVATSPFSVDLGNLTVSSGGALAPGQHVLELRLAENNHSEIEPRVFDRIALEVVP